MVEQRVANAKIVGSIPIVRSVVVYAASRGRGAFDPGVSEGAPVVPEPSLVSTGSAVRFCSRPPSRKSGASSNGEDAGLISWKPWSDSTCAHNRGQRADSSRFGAVIRQLSATSAATVFQSGFGVSSRTPTHPRGPTYGGTK